MRRLVLALSCLAGAACRRDLPPPPPAAEFLVATADSTFWVQADTGGIRVRGAPLRLAQVDGRFVELYVADDDRSFDDAVFVSQRVYARDLLRGDSTVIWRDTLILPMAVDWGRRHPDAVPLGPDDEENERVSLRATVDVALLGTWGRWVSLSVHHDIERAGAPLAHRTDRATVDAGSGQGGTLETLFGASRAADILVAGERQLAAARAAADDQPEASRERARRVTARLGLSERRFALAVDSARPAAELLATYDAVSPDDPALVLAAIAAPEAPWWTAAERARHPDALPAASSGTQRWTRPRYALEASQDSVGGPTGLALRDATGRRFPVAVLHGAVGAVTWLDAPAPDSATRAALTRAFAEAAHYNEEVRTARAPASRPSVRLAHALLAPRAPAGARLVSRDVAPHDADRREHPRPRLRRVDPRDDRHHRGDLGHAPRAGDLRHGQH
jgi:hypothetical protein